MLRGTVVSLHRWPVKSLGGEDVAALVLDGRGAAGDRTHALLDARHADAQHPRLLTARQAPRMLLWRAAYPAVGDEAIALDDPPRPVLTAPGGERFAWDDPALPAALEADLGVPVALRRDVRGQQDLGDTVLLTTTATHAAVAGALGDLDLRRWRTNVHVRFDEVPAFAEEAWEHGRARIGDVPLDLLHPCLRCAIPTRDPDTAAKRGEVLRWLTRERQGIFGINAHPAARGTIRVGHPVVVEPPAA